MGTFLLITVVLGAIYWRVFCVGSFSHVKSSQRQPFPLGTRQSPMSVEPIITPVDEIKKIPKRLPQVELEFVPKDLSTPLIDREISPNFSTNPSKVEESLLYRALILVLFAIATIAVDLAAGTRYAWLGIPVTAIGSIWSWNRRYDAKHWLNKIVVVASLAIVGACFLPLIREIYVVAEQLAPAVRTPATLGLAFAMLMVLLPMFLSFQFYSRQMLGYCLVASIFLMAVAASFSQNIGFLISLSGFILIAIPTLMLDYRSKLSLKPIGVISEPEQSQLSPQHLPWKYLNQLAIISIVLGLIISIFLPNFHFPDLSFTPPKIDERLQTLAQKYKLPNPPPPAPSSVPNPPPAINQAELARKVFGQPGNNNYPDTIKQENLQLPPELAPKLTQLTQQILATSPQPLKSDFDRATYLAEYLKQHHQDAPTPVNSANLPPLDAKSINQIITPYITTPQTCKLTEQPQDLPVVYTSMLRSIDIPARLKIGEQPAQIDPNTKLYPRPPKHPPSRTEMYSPNWGWVDLDPTPNQPVLKLTPQQETQLQAQLQQPPTPTLSPTPQPQVSPTNSTPPPNPDRSTTDSTPPPPAELPKWDINPLFLKTIVISIAIIGGIFWYLSRQRQQQQYLATLPPIERIYRSMILSLSHTGNTKLPSQTQLEYAQSIKNTEHPQIAQVATEISQLYVAWRYGNETIDINRLTKKLGTLQYLQQLAANRQRQQWFTKK